MELYFLLLEITIWNKIRIIYSRIDLFIYFKILILPYLID